MVRYKMNKETKEYIKELEDKYFQLVWFMRKHFDTSRTKHLANRKFKSEILLREIEEKYSNEAAALLNDDGGRYWEHGFNSGCLAMLRFILTATNRSKFGGLEQAKEEFPFLDT